MNGIRANSRCLKSRQMCTKIRAKMLEIKAMCKKIRASVPENPGVKIKICMLITWVPENLDTAPRHQD